MPTSHHLSLHTSAIRLHTSSFLQLFIHQLYGHTFPITEETSEPKVHEVSRYSRILRMIALSHFNFFVPYAAILSRPFMFRAFPCGSPQGLSLYCHWFLRLYCSVSSRSFLNFSTLSGFIFPAFIALRFALSQLRTVRLSSSSCFDGFRLLVSMKFFTSLYFAIHLSSCVIVHLRLLSPSVQFQSVPLDNSLLRQVEIVSHHLLFSSKRLAALC